MIALQNFSEEGVNDEICDFHLTIDPLKISLQILSLLLEDAHLETKRSNEEQPDQGERASERTSERTVWLLLYLAGENGGTQG
jgi:hypothetical protein